MHCVVYSTSHVKHQSAHPGMEDLFRIGYPIYFDVISAAHIHRQRLILRVSGNYTTPQASVQRQALPCNAAATELSRPSRNGPSNGSTSCLDEKHELLHIKDTENDLLMVETHKAHDLCRPCERDLVSTNLQYKQTRLVEMGRKSPSPVVMKISIIVDH